MSSAAGKTPAPGQAVYSASKYALNGYFHTLRSEVCRLCTGRDAIYHDKPYYSVQMEDKRSSFFLMRKKWV